MFDINFMDRLQNLGTRRMKQKWTFKKKNIVSSVNVPMSKLLWEYICWVLAGKPEERNNKNV